MNRAEALATLQQFQRWRRDEDAGDDAPSILMPEPRLIGQALDVALAALADLISTEGAAPMATPKTARKNAKRNLKKAAEKGSKKDGTPIASIDGGPGAPPPPKKL